MRSWLFIAVAVLLLSAFACFSAADSCCTPPRWTTQAITINPLGAVHHQIYYDSVKKWVRWERSGNTEVQGEEEEIISWTDYNNLVEWVYWPAKQVCLPYHPNEFYHWCYGVENGQVLKDTITIAEKPASVWKMPNGPNMQWVSLDSNCLPAAHQQPSFSSTTFFNTTIGAPPASVWDLPSVCKKTKRSSLEASKPMRYGVDMI